MSPLPADTNQARGIAQYAIDFVAAKIGEGPTPAVWQKLEKLHIDSVGLRGISVGPRLQRPDDAAKGGVGIPHRRQPRRLLLRIESARESRKSGRGQLLGRARVGRQWNQLRLRSDPRPHGRRVWSQRFLPRGHRRGSSRRARWSDHAARHVGDRRNPRPVGGSVFAQVVQDRSCAARSDCLGSGLRRDAGGHRRSNRIGHRIGRGSLRAVSRHSPRQAAFRFQGRFRRHQRRSGGAEHAACDAWICRPRRCLPQSRSGVLLVRETCPARAQARSIWR